MAAGRRPRARRRHAGRGRARARGDRSLKGRVALVTGGAGGLGRELVARLAERGARVAVNYASSHGPAQELAAQVGGVAVGADVSDETGVLRMVAEVEASLGPVDLLVNNAAVTTWAPYDRLDALDVDTWRRIQDVNVLGAFLCVRAVAPRMRERGFGSVLNVSSDSAFSGVGSSLPYAASKAALVNLTLGLAQALAPEVRVNAVAPGWMDTPWLERYVPEEVRGSLRAGGAGPTIAVAEVADAALELLAGDATGQVRRF